MTGKDSSPDPYAQDFDWDDKWWQGRNEGANHFYYLPMLRRTIFGIDHREIWMRDIPLALGLIAAAEIDALLECYADGDETYLERVAAWREQHAEDAIPGWIDREGRIRFHSDMNPDAPFLEGAEREEALGEVAQAWKQLNAAYTPRG